MMESTISKLINARDFHLSRAAQISELILAYTNVEQEAMRLIQNQRPMYKKLLATNIRRCG